MALTAYPFDNQTVSEQQYGDLFGAVAQSGILGSNTANNFLVTAGGSNMNLTVTSVSGASRALLRGHAVLMTANEVVTVPAASAQARVDLVVLRLDYAANTIAPAVRQGTAGSSTPPAPVWGAGGIYELPLAQVAVGANVTTISSGNLTDRRLFSGPTSGVWTTASRPSTPLSFGYNSTLGRWEYTLNGTTWLNIGYVDLSTTAVTGTLPVARGGTGVTSLNALRTALGFSGTTADALPIASGGTGAATAADARTALGVTPANIGAATDTHGHALTDANITGVLPVAQGGTGTTSLNSLRSAIGIGGNTNQPVPVANGGTGATTRDGVRNTAVDLYLQSSAPSHSVGRLWLKTP